MEREGTQQVQLSAENFGEFKEILTKAFLQAQQRANAKQGVDSVLVSVTVSVPLGLQEVLNRVGVLVPGVSQIFWSSPHDARVLLGIGSAHTLIVNGSERFSQLKVAVEKLKENWSFTQYDTPKFVGGFSFQPGPRMNVWAGWEDGLFVLPCYMFEVVKKQGCRLTFSHTLSLQEEVSESAGGVLQGLMEWLSATDVQGNRFQNKDRSSQEDGRFVKDGRFAEGTGVPTRTRDLPRDEWETLVRQASERIQTGGMRKVVLARQHSVRFQHAISVQRVVSKLRYRYPESFAFSIWRSFGCFAGASPERLIKVEDGVADVDALAGTIRRGGTAEEDQKLAQELMHSVKDRREHAVVVERISHGIADLVEEIVVPEKPVIKKLANVQHLFTPICGKVKGNLSVINFVEQLHPTPAVAGEPRAVALEVISQYEQLDRGWYASPVGWFSPMGDGEFNVALRSALIQAEKAYLYAGAGIMADSKPESEWEETELKMQAMKMALEDE